MSEEEEQKGGWWARKTRPVKVLLITGGTIIGGFIALTTLGIILNALGIEPEPEAEPTTEPAAVEVEDVEPEPTQEPEPEPEPEPTTEESSPEPEPEPEPTEDPTPEPEPGPSIEDFEDRIINSTIDGTWNSIYIEQADVTGHFITVEDVRGDTVHLRVQAHLTEDEKVAVGRWMFNMSGMGDTYDTFVITDTSDAAQNVYCSSSSLRCASSMFDI